AVVKADSCDLVHVIMAMAEEAVASDCGLESDPAIMAELHKFGLLPPLVQALQAEVGYPAPAAELSGDEPFALGRFLIRLLVTGFCESIGDVPGWAADLAMSSASSRATARAFLSRWRDSSRYYKVFDTLS